MTRCCYTTLTDVTRLEKKLRDKGLNKSQVERVFKSVNL